MELNRLSPDFSIQCRLCSSKHTLVSLFQGKNKKIRSYIRLIVKVVTGVEYERNAYFKCICLTCVIFTYNQYIFLVKSVENEERLQSILENKSPSRRNKYYVKCPKDLELLDSTEVKKALVEWIVNKQEITSGDSSDQSSSLSDKTSIPDTDNRTKSNQTISSASSIQKKTKTFFDVGVQTTCKPSVSKKDANSQTETNETKEQFTQYEIKILHASKQYVTPNKVISHRLKETKNDSEHQLNKNGDDSQVKKNCDKTIVDNERLVGLPNATEINSTYKITNTVGTNVTPIGLEFTLLTPKSTDISNNNTINENINQKSSEKQSQINDLQQVLTINCQTNETDDIKIEQVSPPNLCLNSSIHLKDSPRSEQSFNSTNNTLMEAVDMQNLQMCPICEEPFNAKSTFDAHKKKHRKCSLCQKTFRSIKKRDEHYTICTMLNRDAFVKVLKMDYPINSATVSDAVTTPTTSKKTAKKCTAKSGGKKRKSECDKGKPLTKKTNRVVPDN